MAAKSLTIEITDGITEHSNRVALKGVFQAFGDVLACWVPPVDRRGIDNASVRFASQPAADAAKIACDNGQVYFQGMLVRVKFRSGGGPRVGNSDVGDRIGGNSPNRDGGSRHQVRDVRSDKEGATGSRSIRNDAARSRSRGRRRRSQSPRRYRSRSRRRRSRSRTGGVPETPALTAGAEVQSAPQVGGAPPAPWTGGFAGTGLAAVPAPPSVTGPPPPTAAEVAALEAQLAAERKAEEKRLQEAKAKRAAQTRRGPGVAALVQGALKNVTVLKKSQPEEERVMPKNAAPWEKVNFREREKDKEPEIDAAATKTVDDERKAKRRDTLKLSSTGEWLTVDPSTGQEKKVLAEKEQAEREQIRLDREQAERKARERKEKAEQEKADEEQLKHLEERKRREERVRAGIEAAKKADMERKRSAQGAVKTVEDNLYGEMPAPDPVAQAAMRDAQKKEEQQKRLEMSFSHLPAEDRSKVVFLDVDGVMRPARAGGFDVLAVDGEAVRPDTSDFFASAIKALRLIIERTGAIVVLSAEWRRNETLRQALDDHLMGNRLRPCFGATRLDLEERKGLGGGDPVRSFAERRAREISAWLGAHEDEVKGWVVLDDINLSIADEDRHPETRVLGPKLVQTWPLCGLTVGNAKTAVRILNGEMINKVVVERAKAPTNSGRG